MRRYNGLLNIIGHQWKGWVLGLGYPLRSCWSVSPQSHAVPVCLHQCYRICSLPRRENLSWGRASILGARWHVYGTPSWFIDAGRSQIARGHYDPWASGPGLHRKASRLATFLYGFFFEQLPWVFALTFLYDRLKSIRWNKPFFLPKLLLTSVISLRYKQTFQGWPHTQEYMTSMKCTKWGL